jgi:aerobic-type carbon monoxide dehydrogenase small subunit (CoxS/CutS family)
MADAAARRADASGQRPALLIRRALWRNAGATPLRAIEGGTRVIRIDINGKAHDVDADPGTPLLWVLRDHLNMTGTKYGCGIAQCGACTVHVDGRAVRACVLPVSAVGSQPVTTIEGLSSDRSHPVQQAWVEHDVPQCGYCQSGQIMAVAALLASNPRPTDADIDREITNICRCGTYQRIRSAIHRAAELSAAGS